MFKDKRCQEIAGIILILLSLIFLLAFMSYSIYDYSIISGKSNNLIPGNSQSVNNLIGPLGAWLSHLLRSAFGLSAYIFVAITFIIGMAIIRNGTAKNISGKFFSLFFIIITVSSLISLFSSQVYQLSGGYIGFYIYKLLRAISGQVGAYLIISIMNIVGLILFGIISLTTILDYAKSKKDLAKKISHLIGQFHFKKYRKDIPLNCIEDELYMNKNKIPWIIKKKIILYNNESKKTGYEDSIKFLEMSVPFAANDKSLITRDESQSENSEDEIFYPDEVQDAPDINLAEVDEINTDFIEVGNPVKEIETVVSSVSQKSVKNPDEIETNRITNIGTETAGNNSSNVEDRVFANISINDEYIVPTSFLDSSVPVDTESWENEVRKNSVLLVNTLADFGIESKVIRVNRGPVITLYELQIAPGIKVNKIVGLSDDIAMALAALRVRIVAPIPGKSAIGIEIPNKLRETVTLGDVVKSEEYQNQKGFLKVALGQDILGKPITLDIRKLPHLLIAGATGSGKSVCVNAIISSIVYNYNPNQVRFILVDPKMVELQLYNGLPHLLTPVITEPHTAPMALKWAIYEMDRRYRLLSELNSRDIERYNKKAGHNPEKYEELPYIVIIIDELADLMVTASKEIEGHITRIAQKSRAIGIHLVLATQRPSVDIITGIIKANFPARIAFQVAQKTDSRTILDQNGAEKLLGKGDMLYQSPVNSFPIRIQGAFISEEEIINIVDHLSKMGVPDYIDIAEVLFEAEDEKEVESSGDELFTEALKIIEETRKASASYLQRRLSIGYNRAARMIEQMEDLGYIGPQQGSKPREVFI